MKKRIHGELVFIHSMLDFNDIWKMSESFTEAHSLLQGRSQVVRPNMTWAFGCPQVSYLFLRDAGSYRAMIDLIGQNLHKYRELTDGCSAGGEELFRAEWLLERGELDEVEPLVKAALVQADRHEQPSTRMAAHFLLARLSMARGEPENAAGHILAQKDVMGHLEHLNYANCFDLSLGYVYGCLGDLTSIPDWLRKEHVAPKRVNPILAGFFHIVHAKSVLLSGDYERAEVLAKSLPSALGRLNNLFGHIHARAVEAAAVCRLRGPEAAIDILHEALALSEPDGIVMILAEYGSHLLPVLSALPETTDSDHFRRVVQWTEKYARMVSEFRRALPDPHRLTPREREMMRLVVMGDSNIKIAKRLRLAQDTVKKTLSSAYRKLKAKNRAEAARLFLDLEKNFGK